MDSGIETVAKSHSTHFHLCSAHQCSGKPCGDLGVAYVGWIPYGAAQRTEIPGWKPSFGQESWPRPSHLGDVSFGPGKHERHRHSLWSKVDFGVVESGSDSWASCLRPRIVHACGLEGFSWCNLWGSWVHRPQWYWAGFQYPGNKAECLCGSRGAADWRSQESHSWYSLDRTDQAATPEQQ